MNYIKNVFYGKGQGTRTNLINPPSFIFSEREHFENIYKKSYDKMSSLKGANTLRKRIWLRGFTSKRRKMVSKI